MQVGDAYVGKADKRHSRHKLEEEFVERREDDDVVHKAHYEYGDNAEQEELRFGCPVQAESGVGQHKGEEDVQSSYVGYFAGV